MNLYLLSVPGCVVSRHIWRLKAYTASHEFTETQIQCYYTRHVVSPLVQQPVSDASGWEVSLSYERGSTPTTSAIKHRLISMACIRRTDKPSPVSAKQLHTNVFETGTKHLLSSSAWSLVKVRPLVLRVVIKWPSDGSLLKSVSRSERRWLHHPSQQNAQVHKVFSCIFTVKALNILILFL